MIKPFLFLILPTAILFSGCEKAYVCECKNPGSDFTAFSTMASKEKANQKCKEYYDKNYGNIPMNETVCDIK